MLTHNNRTRLERRSSMKNLYFPDVYFVLRINEFLDFVHCIVFQENTMLWNQIHCVLSECWMMEEAQKLSNLKWNTQLSEGYWIVLCNCTFFFSVYFLQILISFFVSFILFILYWTLMIQMWNIIQHVIFMSFSSIACFVGLFYGVMLFVLVSLL
jgi:hypothetical protein